MSKELSAAQVADMLSAERYKMVRTLQETGDVVNQIVTKEKSIARIWSLVTGLVIGTLLIFALKLISTVSLTKAKYAAFITYIDVARTASTNPFTGQSGLMTALAIDNVMFNMMFPNSMLPRTLFLLFSSQTLQNTIAASNAKVQDVLNEVQTVVLEGKQDGSYTQLGAICAAFANLNIDSSTCAEVTPCNISVDVINSSFGTRMASAMLNQGTNGAFAGHMMSSSPAGLAIGALVGVAIGAGTAALDQRSRDDICRAAAQTCNPSASGC